MKTSHAYVLSLTGRAELRDPGGVVVPLRTRKTMLLLAMLALASPEPLPRTTLAQAIWDGAEPKSAREGLRTALAALRKVLPEGAIASQGDEIALRDGRIEVSLEAEGDFMPGFDNDWAIDHRLRLRALSVRKYLDAARAAADPAEALKHAERACAIDPLDVESSELRAELLRTAGRHGDAATVQATFRTRLVRELGIMPEVSESKTAPEHPLVAAAEWMIDRDPEEACAMLASTQNQWTAMSVDRALEIHRRVLAATTRPSKERRTVETGTYFLLALNGRMGDHLDTVDEAYRDALAGGELTLAARMVEALAYASLSAGDFARALAYAQGGLRDSHRRSEPDAVANAEIMLGIIELHVGDVESSGRRIEKAYHRAGEGDSLYLVAAHRIAYAGSLVRRGKIDGAASLFDGCRRMQATLGSERLRLWLLVLEAEIHESMGDFAAARSILERLRDAAPGAGQSAVAISDDSLLRVNCRLGELDEAADALARVATYRRRMGTVASRMERAQTRPAVMTLKDRLSPADLAAAFRRAGASV